MMQPEISVVVPMRNEAPNVAELYRELTAALEAFGRPYEIIAIDDGSTDDTFAQLAQLQAADRAAARDPVPPQLRPDGGVCRRLRPRPRPLHRHDPTAICRTIRATSPAMVDAARAAAADIVAGWRKDRKDTFLSRRLPSMIANRGHLVGDRREAARLRLLAEGVSRRSRQADEALRRDAPLPAGDRQRDRRHDRRDASSTIARARHGTSKYGISRTIRVILDLMTVKFLISYSTRPLQIFGLLGLGDGRARRR